MQNSQPGAVFEEFRLDVRHNGRSLGVHLGPNPGPTEIV
jgi:hypothetical protein